MKGRPPSRNKGLRDGYYLEVFNKGASSGIKIRKETEEEMMQSVEEYRKENKTVYVLGQHKKGEWMNPIARDKKEKNKRPAPVEEVVATDELEFELLDEDVELGKEPGEAKQKQGKEKPVAKEKPAKEKPAAKVKEAKTAKKPAPAAKKKAPAAPAKKKAEKPVPAKSKKKAAPAPKKKATPAKAKAVKKPAAKKKKGK